MTRLDCSKLERCPGCPGGREPYEAGLAGKGELVREVLSRFGLAGAEVSPARGALPTEGYRLRAKLVADRKALGLYERGQHRVIDVSGCPVLSPALSRASDALRAMLPLPLHGADLRETSEGVLVTLLSDSPRARPELERAAQALVATGGALSVAVSLRPEGSVRLLAGEPELVAGPAEARHHLEAEAPYAYAAHGAFVQAHAGQASYVQRAIAEGLGERCGELAGKRVLELFAGSGSLALRLARAGAQVTAVEAYRPALALAERAAREQGLELTAVADDAARFLTSARGRFDAVIVNPPRRGLEPMLRRALQAAEPRALAYVSCNPSTLARDLLHLRQLGLAVTSAEPLDMIPWSDAVEVLAWAMPTAPPAPVVLFEDEHWLAFERPAHEVLGAGPSGVAFRAKTPEGELSLARALATAERELALLVRGNLRKQGTVTRRDAGPISRRGARYKKTRDVGRHSLVSALVDDADELGALRDFASIGHPVLGDSRHGDARSNQHFEHRHGLDRAFVHVTALRLASHSGAPLEVRSPLPADLAEVLRDVGSD